MRNKKVILHLVQIMLVLSFVLIKYLVLSEVKQSLWQQVTGEVFC